MAEPNENTAPLAWFAVHTRSRHERKVSADLSRQSFEVFFPEYRCWSRRKDRRKQIERPLFPGYLFVRTRLNPQARLAIIKTSSVVRMVGIGTQAVAIPDHEIASIQVLLQHADDASPQDQLGSGQLVQVMEGPLRGVIGVVDQSRKRQIVVNVELLGRAVAATVDLAAVVPYLDG